MTSSYCCPAASSVYVYKMASRVRRNVEVCFTVRVLSRNNQDKSCFQVLLDSENTGGSLTMAVIKLRCMDGRVFEVDVEVARVSRTLRSMLDHLGVQDGEEIPLPKLDSLILEKVLEWADHHKGDPPTDDPEEIRERTLAGFSEWDKEFFNVDQATLLDVLLAANYLDMRALVDAACKSVADLIRGKTPEQIREVMGIENDFSPEEEQKIKDEINFSK